MSKFDSTNCAGWMTWGEWGECEFKEKRQENDPTLLGQALAEISVEDYNKKEIKKSHSPF